jgi:hypothetical protein
LTTAAVIGRVEKSAPIRRLETKGEKMESSANETAPRDKIAAAMAELGLTIESQFVPFSQSRNKDSKWKSLNWRYPASRFRDMAADFEIESGREALSSFGSDFRPGAPILPDSVDVMWSLSRDADVLDSGGFEDWAAEYGYDSDSRSAESTYRACLEIALKLRGAIGEAGIEKLREAGEDF